MLLLLAAALVTEGPSARAEEGAWLLDLEASGGAPVAAPQRDWFGGGGSLAIGVGRPLAAWLLAEARLRTALFLDGDPPETPGVRDPGLGTLHTATLGILLRLPNGSVRRTTGPWASAALGGALTGRELRATWEAGIGYGIGITDTVAIGPLLRFVQVIQPADALEATDARLLLGGVRLSLFDRTPPRAPTRHDRDGDRILDERDRCPDQAEDPDGFEDEDGCPEPDNDRDNIPDRDDGCPNIPEDVDGFQDEDGCLDEDNDKDGVLDADDECPLEPETVNGERDDDGCPDEGLIVMRDDRVVLEERVLFDTNSPRVKRTAEPVLRAIVKLQQQHPEWTKMRIEGHADRRGDAELNQRLSERRATNVREALIALGMQPELVVAEGFGASRPLNAGTSEEAYRSNRRVEFVVVARVADASAPLLTPSSVGGLKINVVPEGAPGDSPPAAPAAPPAPSSPEGAAPVPGTTRPPAPAAPNTASPPLTKAPANPAAPAPPTTPTPSREKEPKP